MFLSRLVLDPRSRAVQRDLADCQQLHRTIMAAFPETTPPDHNAREYYGVLHRLEVEPAHNRLILYVQSRIQPDWSRLPSGYTLRKPEEKSITQSYRALTAGTVLAFRLKANPSKRLIAPRFDPEGRQRLGQRVELRREEEQLDWLRRKGEQGGFDLISARVVGHGKEQGRRTRSRAVAQLTVAAVTFQGYLRITDADTFYNNSLSRGLGPGKAYGLGLLSLAPP